MYPVKRIAVVGAGPVGIQTAELLVGCGCNIYVDLFERIPAPFGLIRYGLSEHAPGDTLTEKPDAPATARLKLFGNVCVGGDITVAELRRHYGAVVVSPDVASGAGFPATREAGRLTPGVYTTGTEDPLAAARVVTTRIATDAWVGTLGTPLLADAGRIRELLDARGVAYTSWEGWWLPETTIAGPPTAAALASAATLAGSIDWDGIARLARGVPICE